jgi:hypothetical protein
MRLTALVSDVKKKTLSHHKVRTSLQDRTLDSMFPVANPAQISAADSSSIGADPPQNAFKPKDIKESECYLTSVKDLRDSVSKCKHNRAFQTFVSGLNAHIMIASFVRNSGETYFCGNRRSRSLSVTSAAFNKIIPCESRCSCVCALFRR